MRTRYKVQRLYFRKPGVKRTIKSGLPVEQAQAHCSNPETSSSTCRLAVNTRRTRQHGPWFESYTEEEGGHRMTDTQDSSVTANTVYIVRDIEERYIKGVYHTAAAAQAGIEAMGGGMTEEPVGSDEWQYLCDNYEIVVPWIEDSPMAYTRKTIDTYQLWANYGYGDGWAFEIAEYTAKDARERLREYQDHAPAYQYKIVHKRIKKVEETAA
jgi:hypothetical protein